MSGRALRGVSRIERSPSSALLLAGSRFPGPGAYSPLSPLSEDLRRSKKIHDMGWRAERAEMRSLATPGIPSTSPVHFGEQMASTGFSTAPRFYQKAPERHGSPGPGAYSPTPGSKESAKGYYFSEPPRWDEVGRFILESGRGKGGTQRFSSGADDPLRSFLHSFKVPSKTTTAEDRRRVTPSPPRIRETEGTSAEAARAYREARISTGTTRGGTMVFKEPPRIRASDGSRLHGAPAHIYRPTPASRISEWSVPNGHIAPGPGLYDPSDRRSISESAKRGSSMTGASGSASFGSTQPRWWQSPVRAEDRVVGPGSYDAGLSKRFLEAKKGYVPPEMIGSPSPMGRSWRGTGRRSPIS